MFQNENIFMLGNSFESEPFTMPNQQSYQQNANEYFGADLNDQTIKYTCRFDIQIPNDKEFQVARRLIGAKGCNMKKIIENCSKDMHS